MLRIFQIIFFIPGDKVGTVFKLVHQMVQQVVDDPRFGGLKACAWADLIQGSALIVGGAVILWFAFQKLGMASEAAAVVSTETGAVSIQTLAPDASAVERFWDLNRPRMNMFLPSSDIILPWTALLLGLWIPNFYYWGLNQYITQRTLGSASLAQGQRGIVFAAFMKLLVPFVIVIPGIIAFNLYSTEMRLEARGDTASGHNGPGRGWRVARVLDAWVHL